MKYLLIILLLISVRAYSQDTISVYFKSKEYVLNNDSALQLNSKVKTFAAPQSIKISIFGFADAIGDTPYNKELSLKRAISVRDYLVKNGFLISNINSTEAFGESKANQLHPGDYTDRKVNIVFENIQVKKDLTITERFKKLKIGETIILDNINFFRGTNKFTPESKPSLLKLAEALMHNPEKKIRIEGHTCCSYKTPDDQNAGFIKVSTMRAKAVYDYLLDNGIKASRLSYIGLAGRHPLVYPEKDVRDEYRNMRVEIRVVE